MTPRFLIMNAEALAPALAMIFNDSMQTGIVPNDWKKANVTPIFKKGSKGNPGNYRPVSLTSIVCMIMESCIRDSIVAHLTINSLIKRLPARIYVPQVDDHQPAGVPRDPDL